LTPAVRKLENHRLRSLDRGAARIHDFEDGERIQCLVPHLENESRLLTEHDGPDLRWRLRGLRTGSWLPLPGGRCHERDANTPVRRHREFLRLQVFPIDRRGRPDAGSRLQAGEFSAAAVVGLC